MTKSKPVRRDGIIAPLHDHRPIAPTAASQKARQLRPNASKVTGLAKDQRIFSRGVGVDPTALERDLTKAFGELVHVRERNPFGNSVKLLALEIAKKLDAGTLEPAALEDLVQKLVVSAYHFRATRLGQYLGHRDHASAERVIHESVSRLAYGDPLGERRSKRARTPIPFDAFKERIERELFGIVITAHPTFSQSEDLLTNMAELAIGEDLSGKKIGKAARRSRLEAASRAEHRPPENINLAREHALSVVVLRNIQDAIRRVYEIVFDVARAAYPDRWRELTPAVITVASWVGYDLDGRSDISWSDTLFKRLALQVAQLERYLDSVRGIISLGKAGGANGGFVRLLELMQSRIALAIKEANDEIDVFQAKSIDRSQWTQEIRRLAKRMHDGRDLRLIDSSQLLDLIENALRLTDSDDICRNLLILRAEIANHGLGLAHTHVRLNSTQIHNAIRKLIGMETEPDDPARKRSYMAAMTRALERVQPVSISFASILAERTSAKRLFMIVAKMLKYIDATTPVRFLIAESESSLTLLAALYFAKYFAVEDRIDISPLFETTKAFERGMRVIDECLQNPIYAAYVRRRGRLCIQTGFSDAGRHLGQMVAGVSIEWFRLKLADLLRDRGFADVEVVIFDTHGESIGRGGHPEGFRARLEYVASPASRAKFSQFGIRAKEETSFQGGDGYAYFVTPQIALASMSWIVEYALDSGDSDALDDPAYTAEEDYVKEFFITVRHFNEQVMDDPHYAMLLDCFGPNLLFPSGSRALKRQHEGLGARRNPAHPTQMRAIPHNGILQQLGYLANTIGGVGEAIRKDPERFQRLYATSTRFRRVLGMAEWALDFTDLEAIKSYLDLFDPGQWLSRAYQSPNADRARELRQVAEQLEIEGTYEQLAKIYRVFQRDLLDLRDGLALLGERTVKIDPAAKADLRLMHAIRIALLMRIFSLSTHVPDFSDQHDISRQQLIDQIMHMEIDEAIAKLSVIFPKVEQERIEGDFGEVATYVGDWQQTYEREHQAIFQPIAGFYRLAKRISAGIVHTIGAIG